MSIMHPLLHSSPILKRYENNPILTAADIPYPANLVFNAGVAKFQGRYVMIFRNDYGYEAGQFGGTNLGIAFSSDGIHWDVEKKPFFTMDGFHDKDVTRIYDPRITVIDGRCYVCFAMDTHHGVRGGIGITEDFQSLDIISLTVPDNRNMVLFPEKVGGLYVRLERPFPVYSRGGLDRFDIWLSKSPDLRYWGDSSLLLGVEQVPFSNDKLGPGAPPIKTDKGWLTLFHSVDIDKTRGKNGWEDTWKKRYCTGLMLLDLENPEKVIGMSKEPLIAPETSYETDDGFRTNVVFPGGMILENDGNVKIYYGASDTVECLATANVEDLLKLCEPLG